MHDLAAPPGSTKYLISGAYKEEPPNRVVLLCLYFHICPKSLLHKGLRRFGHAQAAISPYTARV